MILLGASRPDPLITDFQKEESQMDINHTKKILDLCVINKINNIVFASSKNVYGQSDIKPFDEENEPSPDSIYGLNKLLTEKLGFYYSQKYGIKFTALRLSHVFGYGDNYPNMLNIFIRNAFANRDLELWGNPESNSQSYIYVKDAADAFIHFINNENTGIYNIGMSESYSTEYIANTLVNQFPTLSKIIFKPEKKVMPHFDKISVNKIMIKANWHCKWEMDQGLKDYWDELNLFK